VGRPIGALQAAIQALLSGADQDPEMRRELLEGMHAEVNRLHPLLDNLTNLHDQILGTMELNRQSIKLSEWLPRTIGPWREAAQEKELNWRADIPLNLPTINVDPDRMAQVLGNLLSNAVKYTPSGGDVSVSAGTEKEQVWIEVQDTGPGLSEKEIARIFEPFYRSQPGRRFPQGMGLGLTIAQDLIVAHGGQLFVNSQPGQGTKFTIQLPLAQ
jgi:signal transduction histidine kinase